MAIEPKKSRLAGQIPGRSDVFDNLSKTDETPKVQLNVRCTPQERFEIKHYSAILGIGMNEYLMLTHALFMKTEGSKYPVPPKI